MVCPCNLVCPLCNDYNFSWRESCFLFWKSEYHFGLTRLFEDMIMN